MLADRILYNGKIYTQDRSQPWAEAVAIAGGRIIAVGKDNAIRTLLRPGGEAVNLERRLVTPGLVDAHAHFQSYAQGLQRINLRDLSSKTEALRLVSLFAAQQPDLAWIEGRGWNQGDWDDSAFPTALELDSIVPDRPVFLIHKSGHAAWANSLALSACGIDLHTDDPAGGTVMRDSSGQPTGVLLENAIQLISKQIPKATVSEIAEAMIVAQSRCLSLGLTGIHDFDGRSSFRALQQLHAVNGLELRFVKSIPVTRLEHAIGVGLRSGFGDEWLRIGGVKIFADGALGPRTAAMIEPYVNEPGNLGLVVTDKEEMIDFASRASRSGLSLTIHAIGDRANHDVLDVFESVREQELSRGETPALRHRVEHFQVAHPSDFARLKQLDVIASMQPIHATQDKYMAEKHWGERARFSYAWQDVLASGAHLAFGSDAPVETISPLAGIAAAVTRKRSDAKAGDLPWYPEQRVDVATAIRAYTLGPAYASVQEGIFGSIRPGMMADLTIYDGNLFEAEEAELFEIKAAGTVVGGKIRYRNW